jgi:hypothetical protein
MAPEHVSGSGMDVIKVSAWSDVAATLSRRLPEHAPVPDGEPLDSV